MQYEETEFWKDFPRQKKFYSQHLSKIRQVFDKPDPAFRLSGQSDVVRDVDEMLRVILDYLPFASRKYCAMFNLEHCEFLSDEANRTTATFDSLTHSLRMFDTDNVRNWQILGFVVSILVSDTVALLLERRPGHLPQIQVSAEMTDVLIGLCKRFAQSNMAVQGQTSEENDEYTIVDVLFDQVQFIWANQIYPKLSMLSGRHFDACLRMI